MSDSGTRIERTVADVKPRSMERAGIRATDEALIVFAEVRWRRERDSNPRYGFPYSGFQDRLFQPLTHPSA